MNLYRKFDFYRKVRDLMEKFQPINTQALDSELSAAEPILIACIRRGFGFDEQLKVLESISKKFHPWVRIRLMDENHIRSIGAKYAASGDPFYLLFQNGGLKARFLGRADMETLGSFLMENMQ